MVKLRWLQINKFRSVKPGTRLEFNDGYNVLLGQNGAGKTTLLNLVAAVIKTDFRDFSADEFELLYELASEELVITLMVRKRSGNLALENALKAIPGGLLGQDGFPAAEGLMPSQLFADVRISRGPDSALADLEIRGTQVLATWRGKGEPKPTVSMDSQFSYVPLWANVVSGFGSLVDVATPKLVEEVMEAFRSWSLVRFDESLEYLSQVRAAKFSFTRFLDGHISHGYSSIVPDVVAKRLRDSVSANWRADQCVVGDEEIPFLRDAVRILGFDRAELVVQLQEATARNDVDTIVFGGLRFFFVRGRNKISDQFLSYGQKRMLAFVCYLGTAGSVAVVDELVNGLHHSWIRKCIEALGGRQVFLTSQNPLLLDYLSFDSPEQVKSTFVLCRSEKSDGGEHMVWENMSQEVAEDFFESYKVGFQQVGELLQTKGLW